LRASEFATTDLKTVGNYTLGKLIGKGSFGKVYLASHKLSNGSKVRKVTTVAGKEERLIESNRSYSSQRKRTTPTSRARSTTIASLYIRTLRDYTRS
jgi:serine/threonine protein kinase